MLGSLGNLSNVQLTFEGGNTPPPCFGAFDSEDEGCLRCEFQDDCITKKGDYEMVESNVSEVQELAEKLEAVDDDGKIDALSSLAVEDLRALCDHYEIGYTEIPEDPDGDKNSLVLSIDDYYEEVMLEGIKGGEATAEAETSTIATDGADEVETDITPEPVEKEDVGADTGQETPPAVETPEAEVDKTTDLPAGLEYDAKKGVISGTPEVETDPEEKRTRKDFTGYRERGDWVASHIQRDIENDKHLLGNAAPESLANIRESLNEIDGKVEVDVAAVEADLICDMIGNLILQNKEKLQHANNLSVLCDVVNDIGVKLEAGGKEVKEGAENEAETSEPEPRGLRQQDEPQEQLPKRGRPPKFEKGERELKLAAKTKLPRGEELFKSIADEAPVNLIIEKIENEILLSEEGVDVPFAYLRPGSDGTFYLVVPSTTVADLAEAGAIQRKDDFGDAQCFAFDGRKIKFYKSVLMPLFG